MNIYLILMTGLFVSVDSCSTAGEAMTFSL